MDNITLEMNELNICEMFERDIPDDATVINVKINKIDMDDIYVGSVDIRNYITDLGVEILFSTAGIHLNGENKVPHIHWNFITTSIPKIPSNLSQHRIRWSNKKDEVDFTNVSFQIKKKIDLGKPKYQVLTYPLKEGRPLPSQFNNHKINVYDKNKMTKQQFNYLLEVGQSIYQQELATNLRRDKCEERKKQSLNDLYTICNENRAYFSTLKEMARFLDEKYISTLDIQDYPDPKNYKTNLQKIAVKLDILKYSDLI